MTDIGSIDDAALDAIEAALAARKFREAGRLPLVPEPDPESVGGQILARQRQRAAERRAAHEAREEARRQARAKHEAAEAARIAAGAGQVARLREALARNAAELERLRPVAERIAWLQRNARRMRAKILDLETPRPWDGRLPEQAEG